MSALWWHSYGKVLDEGDFAGCWALVTLGETDLSPDDIRDDGRLVRDPIITESGEIPYLKSFDHEPSDVEKDALEPADGAG